MRIFFLTSYVPGVAGGSAVHVMSNEIVRGVLAAGHTLVMQPVFAADHPPLLTPQEQERVGQLEAVGVQALSPLFESQLNGGGNGRRAHGAWLRQLQRLSRLEALYPSVSFRPECARRVARVRPDVILSHASPEGLAAVSGATTVPHVALYGTPDFWPMEARLRHPELFGMPNRSVTQRLRIRLERGVLRRQRRIHVRMIRSCAAVPIPDEGAARFYTAMGHPRAFYLQNIWPPGRDDWEAQRDRLECEQPLKIVGNIGQLNATGSTFGLHYLGTSVLPVLERRLGRGTFEIHLFGPGTLQPLVATCLAQHPCVRVRGYVADLDRELLSAPIFLTLNNSGPFRIGHTRVLHAWSLGGCVVAHRHYTACIPEIQHQRNALLGSSPEEIAELVVLAARDRALRRRLGAAGQQTLRRWFVAEQAVPKLLAELERAVQHAS